MQMRKKRYLRKRKGSTMVMALLIFSILFILSTSVMGTLSMAVKVQTSEQAQTETLYGAESGITYVQSAIERTFLAATQYAQNEAQTEAEFAQAMETFIGLEATNKFSDAATNLQYWQADGSVKPIRPKREQEQWAIFVPTSTYDATAKRWDLEVQSTFTDASAHTRTVGVTIQITIPPWSPAPTEEIEPSPELVAPLLPLLERNTLTIGGNLYLNSDTTVRTGGVFVQGRPAEKVGTVAEKYSGGIINPGSQFIAPAGAVVATGQTYHALGNSQNTINSASLYAQNILVSDQANIEARNAITDNDLVITAETGRTRFDNFYGINDVRIETPTMYRDSSSIIFNPPQASTATLDIPNEAYIAGTAMLDLETPYQTGESVAVKGNYLVYTLPAEQLQTVCTTQAFQTHLGTCEQLVYEYREPLQVITGVQNLATFQAWNIFEKAKYFELVVNTLESAQSFVTYPNNITVAPWNSFAAGALLTNENGKVTVKVPASDVVEKITTMQIEKQPEYAREVYRLGFDQPDLQAVYEQYGQGAWGINHILDFTKGESIIVENQNSWDESINDSLIYNPDKDKTIYVMNSLRDCPVNDPLAICMKISGQYKERLILTAGDVVFTGQESFVFYGAVVAAGDMTIETNGTVTLQLHSNMQAIIDKYQEQLAGVFLPIPTQTLGVTVDSVLNFGYYPPEASIVVERWRLIR